MSTALEKVSFTECRLCNVIYGRYKEWKDTCCTRLILVGKTRMIFIYLSVLSFYSKGCSKKSYINFLLQWIFYLNLLILF